MRLYFLTISILVCFFQVFAGSGNHTIQQSAFASSNPGNLFIVSEDNYPHSELESSPCIISVNSTVRQQTPQSSIPSAEFINHILLKNIRNSQEAESNGLFKQYLLFIYPSHNFW